MSERERFDELEAALKAVFSGHDVPGDVGDEPRDLALLAGYLLGLPREEFRASLKADLLHPEGAAQEKTSPTPHAEETPTQTIIPYVVVPRAEEMMDFVREAFGATEVMRAASPSGFHGEVRIGDSQLMMGGRVGMPLPESLATLHLYVPDADASYRRALEAGATSLSEPADQFYGDREAGVRDPFGNRWFIATHKKGPGYAPEGMRNLTPFFLVQGTSDWMELLKKAFGAQEVARVGSPDGGVRYATMRIGNSILEMGEAHEPHTASTPAMLYVIVDDVDGSYARAVESGAQAVEPPKLQPYGARVGHVKDSRGNDWYLATPVRR